MLGIAGLAFLAALLDLDETSFGRFMVSRPVVCAPLFAFILGDVRTGLWIGLSIELLWTSAIPMGAAIPYDITVLSILTVVWAMLALPGNEAALMIAMILALPTMMLFKKLELSLRYFNVKISHWVEKGVQAGEEKRIAKGVFIGLALYFIKAFVFFLAVIYPGKLLVALIYSQLPLPVITSLELVLWVLPVVGMGMMLVSFHNRFPCPK
jgi:mannose PTS system EIIC component